MERRRAVARVMAGWMIWLKSSDGLLVSLDGSEMRIESAEERDWAASLAWRVCSSRKLSIFRRPRSVSDLQLRSVLSSTFMSMVLGSK